MDAFNGKLRLIISFLFKDSRIKSQDLVAGNDMNICREQDSRVKSQVWAGSNGDKNPGSVGQPASTLHYWLL
jgi:hypothetical protein